MRVGIQEKRKSLRSGGRIDRGWKDGGLYRDGERVAENIM